jgi:hypothetical protein
MPVETVGRSRRWHCGHDEFWRRQLFDCIAIIGFLMLVNGCATPIGVVRGSTQDIQFALTSNVLSSGTPSSWSTQVLHRTNLSERFAADPEKSLGDLRTMLTQPVGEERLRDRLFALSELSFYQAEQSGNSEQYLAAAIYAYDFLFPDDEKQGIDPLDPRGRWAADLYNRGLARGLASPDGEQVVLDARSLSLPFGELTLTSDQAGFLWGGYRFSRFVPVGEFVLRGLSNRYRQAGIGAPLAAELAANQSDPIAEATRKRIPPRTRYR